ncbi:MAG: signal peptidase I [Acidobacteria bacterium]|nr:signal peptidase I [Acidobacteriota bacterium]
MLEGWDMSGKEKKARMEKKAKHKTESAETKAPMKTRVWREVMGWVWVILAFLLIQSTLVQARVIPSGSMEQTLLIGDHLLVSRFGYDAEIPLTPLHMSLWREPQRQQVVIFRRPGQPDFIKRVIGLPGDRVEIRQGAVWINGKVLVEPYVTLPMNTSETYPYQSVTVPPGHYFVMGDNRGDSFDSRYWGFVPRSGIVGTPMFIYMSVEATKEAWQPGNFQERFLAYANAVVRPRLVRWKRLFTSP